MITIEDILSKLTQGNLAVFVGAGVSMGYSGMQGIPNGLEMVRVFAKKFPCITNDEQYKNETLSFEVACQKIKDERGYTDLVTVLAQEINKPQIKPLPAHKLIVNLPFSAYFTTNFDTLIEQAYSAVGGEYHVIVEDKDVAFWRNGQALIIKLHGSIENHSSLVAAFDDYHPFSETKPLIDALTKTVLASKTILFLGFALNDPDFIRLYDDLSALLGKKYMGKHLAVVKSPLEADVALWESKGVSLLDRDLTDFLNELTQMFFNPEILKDDNYAKSPYLKTLHQVTNCPTETIAIDVFIDMLEKEINSSIPIETALLMFQEAADFVFKQKNNFAAFKQVCDDIVSNMKICIEESTTDDVTKCRANILNILRQTKNERLASGNAINKYSYSIIKPSSQILFYSQSIRALDFIKSVQNEVQQSCCLYICECRPKSKEPFYDALQILKSLDEDNVHYGRIIITDSSVTYLMQKGQIQSVIMGAHAVYVDEDNKMVYFVNTSGSAMILSAAEKYGVKVYVIAENKKKKLWTESAEEEVKYIEGEYITKAITADVDKLEVAYDLCKRTANVIFLSEDGIDEI